MSLMRTMWTDPSFLDSMKNGKSAVADDAPAPPGSDNAGGASADVHKEEAKLASRLAAVKDKYKAVASSGGPGVAGLQDKMKAALASIKAHDYAKAAADLDALEQLLAQPQFARGPGPQAGLPLAGAPTLNAAPAPGGSALHGDVCTADDGSGPKENPILLLLEKKKLEDKLKQPMSYPGRDADQDRLDEINIQLNQPADQCTAPPPPPPKDPRVAKLVEETKKELSDEMDPDTTNLDRKVNGNMIEQYYAIRAQLSDYLDNVDPQNSTSKQIGDTIMKAWEKALNDLDDLRRMLANNVMVQNRDAIPPELKKLKDLNKQLAELGEKHKRVEEELRRIDDVVEAIEWADRLLKLNDALEVVGTGVEGVEALEVGMDAAASLANHLPAVLTKVNNLVQVLPDAVAVATTLDGAVANIAKYAKLQAIQFEGYPSMEKLEEAIQRKVEAMHDTLTMINHLSRQQARAQKVYDTKRPAAPKK